MDLKRFIGSGDRIGLVTAPILVLGLILNIAMPARFTVGGPPSWLVALSIPVLVAGVVIWAWSAALILRDVPAGRLITQGPYAWVRHPLYTAVALLVLPWAGFLLDTWLGVLLGAVLYLASRRYAPAEEAELARIHGASWVAYDRGVKLRWL